ncbi:FAD-dependent oxidoreductase [Thalassolituus sp. LLYu03]|uniref:FAD-dependent oxidoreductase n=1 Tax=Thalassolituus sp. LLYu03 TaxID=3421656 RepID=UPI003D2D33B3
MPSSPQRIAIIGSGIAGLSAAWLLTKDHDVTLFETAARPGMGIYSVDIPWARGITSVDIPLRVFTPAYYPNLLRLYATAGIAVESTDHSAAYCHTDNRVFFHYGNWLTKGRSLSFPKAGSLRLFGQHRRFFRAVSATLTQSLPESLTFGDFIEQQSLNNEYYRTVVLPALATVCTCDYDDVRNYPADILLTFLGCGVMAQGLMRAKLGVSEVVERLLEPSVTLQCSTQVLNIRQQEQGVALTTATGEHHFDRVIIATQAQQAAALLSGTQGAEPVHALLNEIPIAHSRMTLHSDTSLLPQAVWPLSPVTYFLDDSQRPEATVDLSKAISRLGHGEPLLQVWNPLREPASGTLLADVQFTRPLVTPASRKAVRQLNQQSADQRILLTGSYLCDGIPLLDGAVDASLRIARLLGSSRAW